MARNPFQSDDADDFDDDFDGGGPDGLDDDPIPGLGRMGADDDDVPPGYFDDEEESGVGSTKTLVLGGVAALLLGSLVGGWLLVQEKPDPATAPAMVADTGATVTQTVPPPIDHPGAGGPEPTRSGLMAPPQDPASPNAVSETDRSLSRRPWLTEGGEQPATGAADSHAGQEAAGHAESGPADSGAPPGETASSDATHHEANHTETAQGDMTQGDMTQGEAADHAAMAEDHAPQEAAGHDSPADHGADTNHTDTNHADTGHGDSAPPAQATEGTTQAEAGRRPPADPAGEGAFATRPRGALLPTEQAAAPPPIPVYPIEEGYRPGRMPTFGDLPPPGSFAALPLPDAPLTDLLRGSEAGLLPVIAPDGRRPWRTYARPFTGDPTLPRIAIVVTGLGMQRDPTEAAINQLPPDVTLAFNPYAETLSVWMGRARQSGHETLLELPVEPEGFPADDPGPLAVLSPLSELENRRRLESTLARGGGYVGVIPAEVGPVTNTPRVLRMVLENLKARGLLYVHLGAPAAVNGNEDVAPPANIVSTVIDDPPYQSAIKARFNHLEDIATAQGFAIGAIRATPVSLYRLSRWLNTLETKGFALAPVSAVMLTEGGDGV